MGRGFTVRTWYPRPRCAAQQAPANAGWSRSMRPPRCFPRRPPWQKHTTRTEKPESGFKYYPNAAALAAQVDFLVVITPGGAGTRHLINAEVLQALGPKGYLVNVARGSVVDESALVQALAGGVITGAGLDVFANEPQVPEALWSMPNVVLTPHMASATHQTRQAMADLAFANMQAGLSGKPLLTPVPECMAMSGH